MFKQGDYVKCVEKSLGLTKGKNYLVTAIPRKDLVAVVDDDGFVQSYKSSRFELSHSELSHSNFPDIKDVIFNQPATIILWEDGTKTVVKVKDDEVYDGEKGLAMAICKKVLGKEYHKVFKAYTPDDCGSITDWYDLGYEMGYKLGTLKKVFNGLKDGIDEVTGN